jgi:hypothetical protein
MSSKHKKELINKSLSNEELVNYMKDVAKEMAMAIKISQDGTFDEIIEQAFGTKGENKEWDEEHSPQREVERTQSYVDKSNSPPKRSSPPKTNNPNNIKEIFNNFNENQNQAVDFDEFFRGKQKLKQPQTFYEKKLNEKQKFEHKMIHLRRKKEKEEMSKMTSTPYINENSRLILEKKNEKIVPIQDRVQTVLLEKNMKRDILKKNIASANESRIEITNPSSFNKQKFNDWVQGQYEHLNEKKNQLEEYKELMKQKEEFELRQMKQKNNNKSKILTRNNEDFNEPIYEKLMKDNIKVAEKKLALIEKYTPSFKPQMISKPPKFCRNVSQKNIQKESMQKKNTSMIITDCDNERSYPSLNNPNSMRGKTNFTPEREEEDENVLISRYRLALENNKNSSNDPNSIIGFIRKNNNVKQRSKSIESPESRFHYKENNQSSNYNKKVNRANYNHSSENVTPEYHDVDESNSAIYSGKFGKDRSSEISESSYMKGDKNGRSNISNSITDKQAKVDNNRKKSQDNNSERNNLDYDLYKINIRNNSAWNRNVENTIVYKNPLDNKIVRSQNNIR